MTAPYNPSVQWQADDKAHAMAQAELASAYRQVLSGARMPAEQVEAVSAEYAARLLARIPGYSTPDVSSF